ncbi:Type II secretion system (T2SS), protein F [uncultured archaeon]|nr:Type II secretion system (T2SS), protein F [uncultured archaeon]
MINSEIGSILFGKWVYQENYDELRENIRKAHIARNVHEYVCSSLFYSLIAGWISLVFGYILARNLTQNSFVIFLITAIFAMSGSYAIYLILISYPFFKAKNRSYRIDQSMPHALTYLYALSRGGMNIIDMFKSLGSYIHIYSGTAEEIAMIVQDMEYFGMDIVTALHNASRRTPSRKFKDFINNLISVINSGGDLSRFFKSRSEYYQETATRDQKSFLETLGLFGEVYVSALVAGPLFLIVIIVVLGLLRGGVELLLSLIIYVIIPVGTLLFIVLIDTISGIREEMPVFYTRVKSLEVFKDAPQLKTQQPHECGDIKRLERYEKRSKIKFILFNPLKIFMEKPGRTFFITVPVSIIYLFFNAGDYTSSMALENHFLMAFLFVIIPFTVFFELRTRKIRKFEERMPDFLKRLAGMNEAGLTLTQAIAHTADSNMGVLTYEIKKIHRAIEWGTITTSALQKFEKHIESSAISRIITLIIKASESTSDIRNVLSIAAKDADIGQRLKQERFANLLIYVLIVYLSFFVFLFIIVVLLVYFLSEMPTVGTVSMFKTSSLSNIKTLFYHASLLQGFFSGLVAGQMGEGNLRAGLKHSIVMLVIAYVVFTYFLQGVE